MLYITWSSLLLKHLYILQIIPATLHPTNVLNSHWIGYFSITAHITWSCNYLFLHLISQINWHCLESGVYLTSSPEPQCIDPGSVGLSKCILNQWMIPRSPCESHSYFWLAVEGLFGSSFFHLCLPSTQMLAIVIIGNWDFQLICSFSPVQPSVWVANQVPPHPPSRPTSLCYILIFI